MASQLTGCATLCSMACLSNNKENQRSTCEGNPSVISGFSPQRASHIEGIVAMSWYHHDIDGLVQERCKSIANALELCLSCTNPSLYKTRHPLLDVDLKTPWWNESYTCVPMKINIWQLQQEAILDILDCLLTDEIHPITDKKHSHPAEAPASVDNAEGGRP